MADIVNAIGNEQQRHWASLMIERNWGGATMVLTEPDAGSDVGAGRTKAIPQPDGTWHLDGVKRFITNGDTDDLFENILHVCWPDRRALGPARRASACSWCRSSTSTRRPVSPVNATGCSSPAWSTRWAQGVGDV